MFRVGIIALLIFAGYELGLHRGRHEIAQLWEETEEIRNKIISGPFMHCKQQFMGEESPVEQCAYHPQKKVQTPDPACQPWETVMYHNWSGRIEDEPESKSCEFDSNKGFPFGDDILSQWIGQGGLHVTDYTISFNSNYWKANIEPSGYISGDCYDALYDVTLNNTHHFKPYKDKYDLQISVRQGDCFPKEGKRIWTRIELRER